MNCAQVKEQLVDFLYEELPPNLRAAFVEHLHGCPGCSAEVASHQKALGQARAALAGPLLQEPPARVHAAVLAAAKEAAATAKRDQPGFLARFWRTPWLLPAFGAVSVAAAVFLVKVLKNPEGLPGQKPRPVDELAVPAVLPAPAATRPAVIPEPAGQTEAATGLAAEEQRARAIAQANPPRAARGRSRRPETVARRAAGKAEAPPRAGAGAPASGASTRFAEPPPPRPAARASRDIDDMLGSVGRRPAPGTVASEATKPTAEKKTRAARDEDRPLWNASPAYAPPAAPEPAAAPAAPPSPSQVMTEQAGGDGGRRSADGSDRRPRLRRQGDGQGQGRPLARREHQEGRAPVHRPELDRCRRGVPRSAPPLPEPPGRPEVARPHRPIPGGRREPPRERSQGIEGQPAPPRS